MEAIVTQHLHRRFRKTVAVRDLSFRIEQGEVFGLIGPDGAGKTTTLRMLAGVLNPTSAGPPCWGWMSQRILKRCDKKSATCPNTSASTATSPSWKT